MGEGLGSIPLLCGKVFRRFFSFCPCTSDVCLCALPFHTASLCCRWQHLVWSLLHSENCFCSKHFPSTFCFNFILRPCLLTWLFFKKLCMNFPLFSTFFLSSASSLARGRSALVFTSSADGRMFSLLHVLDFLLLFPLKHVDASSERDCTAGSGVSDFWELIQPKEFL